MISRVRPSFIVVLLVSLLGLTACGSSTDEATSGGVEREAASSTKGVRVCVSSEPGAGPMDVQFIIAESDAALGPFNLDSEQCAETKPADRDTDVFVNVSDSAGSGSSFLLRAWNPGIGYPFVTVSERDGSKATEKKFSVGEEQVISFPPYTIRVKRLDDTNTVKSFQVKVGSS